MTRRREFARRFGALGLFAAALPGLARAAPADLYYERTVMSVADGRCHLFAPDVASALAVGQAQARGASLRAGTSEAQLQALEDRAQAAVARTRCDSKDMETAASRVRKAFDGYTRVTRQVYPGDQADWRADRENGRSIRWRLSQTSRFGGDEMVFGMAGREGAGALVAVAQFADGATPYAARLVMRDDERTSAPYLDTRGVATIAKLPLTRRLPPASAQRVFWAEARSTAGEDLMAKDMTSGWAFRFPAQAARRLADLDPREAVAVEFVFSGPQDVVRRAYVEVGDFAAGRAFLQMAQR